MKQQKGFTLMELIIAIVFLVTIIVGCIGVFGIAMGNFWWDEGGVLRELRIDHPRVESIVKTERNIFAKSVIVVNEAGERKTYLLDSDVLWNYAFSEKKPE